MRPLTLPSPRQLALMLLGIALLLLLPLAIPGQYVMQLINLGLISLIVVVGLNFTLIVQLPLTPTDPTQVVALENEA